MFDSIKNSIRNFRIWLAEIIAPAETCVCFKTSDGDFKAFGGGGSNRS